MTGPIYLLSSERSGTNFLRERLAKAQTTICCTLPPAHFLRTFAYWPHTMGPFDDDAKWHEAIAYFRRSTIERAVPWPVNFDAQEMANSYAKRHDKTRSLILLAHHFYQQAAEELGFSSYFCKDLWLFDFAQEIAHEIPDAQFIHLARDPRDVCLSQKQRPFGQRSALWLAQDWKRHCDAAMRAHKSQMLAGRSLAITYETLIADESTVIADICHILGITQSSSNEQGAPAMPTSVHEWKNLHQPTMTNNSGKFQTGLRPFEISAIEAVCWNTMRTLGYKTQMDERPRISLLDRALFAWQYHVVSPLSHRLNRWRLRHEGITRRAAMTLVDELTAKFR